MASWLLQQTRSQEQFPPTGTDITSCLYRDMRRICEQDAKSKWVHESTGYRGAGGSRAICNIGAPGVDFIVYTCMIDFGGPWKTVLDLSALSSAILLSYRLLFLILLYVLSFQLGCYIVIKKIIAHGHVIVLILSLLLCIGAVFSFWSFWSSLNIFAI